MDYGQPVNPDIQPESFTSDAGTNNNFDAENNLDLSNNQADWTSPVERNNREIGGKALATPDLQPQPKQLQLEQPLETPQTPEISLNPELGQAVSLEMPPGAEDFKDQTPAEVAKQAMSFDEKSIKDGKDRLSDAGVQEIKAAEKKLDQDRNIADFYEIIRGAESGMVKTHLDKHGDNSAWKKAA